MTPQEESMLRDLVQKMNNTRLQEKDDEAERFLNEGLARNPDALYMLAQTVLVQNIALEQARRQVDEARQQMNSLQQAPPPPAKSTSFLGSLLGHQSNPQPPASQYQPVQYASPQQYAQSGPAPYPTAPSGGSSFLKSAATTAAGVAAGALVFEGVESMLHGGMGGGFGGGGFGGGGFEAPREEIINNYYEEPQGFGSNPGQMDAGGFDTSNDSYDDGGDFGGDDDTDYV